MENSALGSLGKFCGWIILWLIIIPAVAAHTKLRIIKIRVIKFYSCRAWAKLAKSGGNFLSLTLLIIALCIFVGNVTICSPIFFSLWLLDMADNRRVEHWYHLAGDHFWCPWCKHTRPANTQAEIHTENNVLYCTYTQNYVKKLMQPSSLHF